MLLESFKPFVSSKIPANIGFPVKIPSVLNIEIITEKSTIKPPIVSIKLIDDFILSPSISPKLEKEI